MKITGKIVHGAGRGKGLGFPTLNLDVKPATLDHGIYAVWVDLARGRYRGAMSYGPRPTFDDMQPVLEVYVLDYSADGYGGTVTIEVVKKIRDIQKFDSVEALKVQITMDIQDVEKILLEKD